MEWSVTRGAEDRAATTCPTNVGRGFGSPSGITGSVKRPKESSGHLLRRYRNLRRERIQSVRVMMHGDVSGHKKKKPNGSHRHKMKISGAKKKKEKRREKKKKTKLASFPQQWNKVRFQHTFSREQRSGSGRAFSTWTQSSTLDTERTCTNGCSSSNWVRWCTGGRRNQ